MLARGLGAARDGTLEPIFCKASRKGDAEQNGPDEPEQRPPCAATKASTRRMRGVRNRSRPVLVLELGARAPSDSGKVIIGLNGFGGRPVLGLRRRRCRRLDCGRELPDEPGGLGNRARLCARRRGGCCGRHGRSGRGGRGCGCRGRACGRCRRCGCRRGHRRHIPRWCASAQRPFLFGATTLRHDLQKVASAGFAARVCHWGIA